VALLQMAETQRLSLVDLRSSVPRIKTVSTATPTT
jgi:hypothetical protein